MWANRKSTIEMMLFTSLVALLIFCCCCLIVCFLSVGPIKISIPQVGLCMSCDIMVHRYKEIFVYSCWRTASSPQIRAQKLEFFFLKTGEIPHSPFCLGAGHQQSLRPALPAASEGSCPISTRKECCTGRPRESLPAQPAGCPLAALVPPVPFVGVHSPSNMAVLASITPVKLVKAWMEGQLMFPDVPREEGHGRSAPSPRCLAGPVQPSLGAFVTARRELRDSVSYSVSTTGACSWHPECACETVGRVVGLTGANAVSGWVVSDAN